MKKVFKNNKKLISLTLAINVLVTLVILIGVGLAIKTQQGVIFDQFAQEYRDQQTQSAATTTSVLGQESQVIDIVEKANKAVVAVVITREVPTFRRRYEQFGPFRIPRLEQQGTREREVGEGSGFVVSEDGLVVTNRHVVSAEDASYTAVMSDGTTHDLEVIARDSMLDVAVLRMQDVDNLPHLSFGDSADLKLGQSVVAIGNALAEFRNTVSVGVVSGLSRSIVAGSGSGSVERLEGVIQTDAAINPGNSGGPLLDLRGNVVGMNVAVARGSENIGFALPANEVKRIVDSVREHGEIVRPYLGVRYISVTPEIAERNNLSVDYGALVVRGERRSDLAVIPGSPADKAGIEENDIILSVDGISLEERSLSDILRTKEVGQRVRIRFLSDGQEEEVTATLGQAPESR